MANCDKCNKSVNQGEEMELGSQVLCEDCYIDAVSLPVRKMYYESSSNFMMRLKDSYIACPQQYH